MKYVLKPTVAALLAATILSGCASPVSVETAEDAANPDCAAMMLRLPEVVGEAERRDTTSQATAVWGDPSVAVLRCGVTPPGPTTTECVSVSGVDWLSEPAEDHWRFVTYGRDPAVEVLVSSESVSGQTVINSLTEAVSVIPAERHCVGFEDATPVPEPEG